jgi:hypothetical protein
MSTTEPLDGEQLDPDAILAEYDEWAPEDEKPIGSDTPPGDFDPLDRERQQRYHALSEDEKEHYRDLAEYFLNMLDAKAMYGRQLPRGMLAAAMEKTGWSRRTIQRKKKGFAVYVRRHLDGRETDEQRIEKSAPFFIDVPPGREKGQNSLPEDLKKVIVYAVLFRKRFTVTGHNKYRNDEVDFSFLEVYKFAKAVFVNKQADDQEAAREALDDSNGTDLAGDEAQPDADEREHTLGEAETPGEHNGIALSRIEHRPITVERFPSYDTVRRFIHFLMEKMPALFVFGTMGERTVEARLLLKRANDVPAPNVRWQSDVIDLQLYVLHNEQVRPVSLLIIYDDHSRYIVWWTLFFREEVRDPNTGRLKKSYVDSRTVSTSFATAMYVSRCRCWIFYTDHGSYYERSEKGFYVLTDDDEPEVAVSNTKHGRPEGRGKVENRLGKTEQGLASLFPSSYKDRSEINMAQKKAVEKDVTYEEVRDELKDHFDGVNNRPFRKNGTRTRFEVWSSVASLEAPPIRKLAQLPDIEFVDTTVNIRNNWIVSFKGGEWEPRETDSATYRRWADFVAQKATVRIVAVRLDIGWVAEVCLDAERDEWLEIVPKASLPTEVTEHNQAQQGALKTMEEEIAALGQQGEEIIQQQGGMPILRVASKEYEEKSPDAEALVRQTKKRHQNTSSSTSSKGGKKGQGKKKGKGKGKGQSASEPAPPQQPQADAANTVEEEEVSLAALWAAKKAKRKQEGEE